MRFFRRTPVDAQERANNEAEERLPRKRVELPGLWEMDVPRSWVEDESSQGVAFVPPSGAGRLSVFTVRAKPPFEVTDGFVRLQAQKFADVLGLGSADDAGPIHRHGEHHYALQIEGVGRGRATVAVVHVMDDGLIVCAAFHTPSRQDPDWPRGLAAAQGLRAAAAEESGGADASA